MQKKATAGRASSWLDRSPTHLLHQVTQCAGDNFRAQTQDSELTPRQLAVLITVAENEGLSQTGIVERTNIDRSTAAEMVRRMHDKGLLHRRRAKEDARAYAVKITDEGRRALRTAQPIAKRVDESILAALPAKSRETFLDALKTIAQAPDGSARKSGGRS